MCASHLPRRDQSVVHLPEISSEDRALKPTTVSVTNGVGVQPRGGRTLDSDGTQLEKVRDNPG